MHSELQRWAREPLPNGGVVLTAPSGPAAGSICIRPRIPARPLTEIVRSLSADAGAAFANARVVGPIVRLVTDEGEYGALLALRTAGLHWVVGVVGDNELTLVEGTAREPAIRDTVERLLCSLSVGAAVERARMFVYRPPAGWHGVRRPLATCWFAPNSARRLIVCDAVPRDSAVRLTQDLLWAIDVSPPTTRSGQVAPLWAQAELTDARYLYRMRLCGRSEEDLTILGEVMASVEKVPVPRTQLPIEVFSWMT